MLSDEVIKVVNHEAWIELENRTYLKWGHFPETDGKLDPKSIRRAFIVDPDENERAVVIGSDREVI